ncbi:MAG TPA: ABC transporter permease [Longimicrobiales bacterium]|nr:ABC transporter permease [Longimicrobiales bacterium]
MNRESIGRIRALLRKEFRQLLRDPKAKRIMFGAPIIQLMLFGYAATTDVHDVPMHVVDYDRSAASRELQDALTAGGYFRIVAVSDRPAALEADLDAGKAGVGVVIPGGFARDLAGGRGAQVQLLVDGTSSNTGTVAQGYATRIVQQYGIDYNERRGRVIRGGVDLRARAWYNPALLSKVYNVPAIMGMLLMLMCFLLTALNVVREREVGTLEQLMVSPINGTELILGKTIPVAVIALIDLLLIAVVTLLWFEIPFRGSASALLLASSIYILACLGGGLLISTVSRTQQEAFMGMFLMLLPAIILSGFMYPVRNMPEFFQKLTLLNPARHYLEIVRGIFLKGEGLVQLWPQYLALTFMAIAVLWVATRRFKRVTF